MDELGEQIDAGRSARSSLEPSCASVFRDELRNLFPTDARAPPGCGAQTMLLPEFLQSRVPVYQPPRLDGRCCSTGIATRRR